MYLDIGMLRDRNAVESLEFELLLLLRLSSEAEALLDTIFDFELRLLVGRERGRIVEAFGVAIESNSVHCWNFRVKQNNFLCEDAAADSIIWWRFNPNASC